MGLLAQTVAAGDLNACCGILRRVYCETLQEADGGHSVIGRQHRSWAPRPSAPTLSSSAVHAALRSTTTTTTGSSGLSSSTHQESLLQQVLGLGRACLRDNAALVKPSSVSLLCHTAQRYGEWRAALDFCRHLPRPPSPVFLSSLLTPGNAAGVSRGCAEHEWTLDIPNAICVLAQEHGSWAAALATAEDAERRQPLGEPYSVGVLIPYLAASGEPERAAALFESSLAQGALVEPALVQQLVMQTAEMRQWATCLRMLQALTRTQEAALLLPSSIDFFRRLMAASPSWEASMLIFDTARALEVKPDVRTIAILVSQCDEAGAWTEAMRVYDMAVRENFVESLADGRTYHALVRSFSAAQQWEKALEALSWMGKAGDASLASGMGELVELCEQSGQWEAALSVGKSLLEHNPELMSERTALALLFSCAKGGQWQLAMSIFHRQLHDVRATPHPLALCAVLQACTAANRWEQALAVLADARAQQPRTVVPPMAHRLAVKACVRSGQWAQVLAALERMREDGLPQDNHSQRLGLWAAALSGQWQLSLAFLQRIPLRSRTPQDRLVIRAATRQLGPAVDASALRILQGMARDGRRLQ